MTISQRFRQELDKVLKVALEVVYHGQDELEKLSSLPPEVLEVRYKPDDMNSPFCIIDKRISRSMIKTIALRFPDHNIVDEESGVVRENKSSPWTWFNDSLDNSYDPTVGLPGGVVSAAVRYEGEMVVAAVGDPASRKITYATKGGGAYQYSTSLYGTGTHVRLRVSRRILFHQRAFFMDSLLLSNSSRSPKGRFLWKMAENPGSARSYGCMNLRSTGSTIRNWVYLAQGSADVVLADSIGGFWDIAPGILLVSEADGDGVICNIEGNTPTSKDHAVLGHTGPFHDELLPLFQRCYKNYRGFRNAEVSAVR